jgi:hypothetical protein
MRLREVGAFKRNPSLADIRAERAGLEDFDSLAPLARFAKSFLRTEIRDCVRHVSFLFFLLVSVSWDGDSCRAGRLLQAPCQVKSRENARES